MDGTCVTACTPLYIRASARAQEAEQFPADNLAVVLGSDSITTPTPTLRPGEPTHTPTATPTPLPPICIPRPTITVKTSKAVDGRLRVVISAETIPGGPTNTVRELLFGSLTNGRPEDAAGVSPPPPPAPGATEVEIFVRRTGDGGVTIPFGIVDGCGEWKTFVGGGAGAI